MQRQPGGGGENRKINPSSPQGLDAGFLYIWFYANTKHQGPSHAVCPEVGTTHFEKNMQFQTICFPHEANMRVGNRRNERRERVLHRPSLVF